MTDIFVCADLHLGHHNILTFKDRDGELIRGKVFRDIEHHDQSIIDRWNSVVKPVDHVYVLGDVVINKKSLVRIKELNGHKRLVPGNHDIFPIEMYLEVGFEKVYGVRVFPKHGLIFSHIPLHSDCLKSRGWTNVHGHLHNNVVLDSNNTPDSNYMNVSMERINYTPVLLMR